MTDKIVALFKSPFLKEFVLVPSRLQFLESELVSLDQQLNKFEKLYLNPDIEKNLIARNELMTSFAISKAEFSVITMKEATEVYELILHEKNFSFIKEKLEKNKKLTQKDHDKLEFFNIAKTFRELNKRVFSLENLSLDMIKNIHSSLTAGMDIFQKYLPNFTPYQSGKIRDNDRVRVGDYIPAPHILVTKGTEELISWIKKNPGVVNTAIFHTALYAVHPFNNGNKRICRILEHLILRSLNFNSQNLFSTSFYYHEEKSRYYKYLLASLERKNLTYFTNFMSEAFALSITDVVRSSLKQERLNFINEKTKITEIRKILKPLASRKELNFKSLFSLFKKSLARQTFVNYLGEAVNQQILKKREEGNKVFYSLNFSSKEEETLKLLLDNAKKHLNYIPDKLKLSV